MAIDPIALIRRFEPILYFHKEETFFPSDAKRYLEHCALWKAQIPFEDKTSWKEIISAKKIAAAQDEISQPGQNDDIYLGQQDGTEFPFLSFIAGEEERFLNPSGWINSEGSHEPEVTSTSANRFAALTLLSRFYGDTSQAIPTLRDSRFWYHAESFDTSRLKAIAQNQQFTTIDIHKFLFLADQFKEPYLLCYYLFFPGHLEDLQGCELVGTGANFGSFAGEWACVAILLDRDDPGQEFKPKFLGLASRNANKNGESGAQGRVRDFERRVGIIIHSWTEADIDVFAAAPDHVRLFVAKGTHSLYLKPGEKDLQPLSTRDPTTENCGASEPLAPTVSEAEKGGDDYIWPIIIAKIVGSTAVLSALIAGGAVGLLVGMIWAFVEGLDNAITPFDPAPRTPFEPQKDMPPEAGDFGRIVHPPNFTPPDASPSNRVSWPKNTTVPINERTYSIVVDRTNPDEAIRQIWFPPATSKPGYEGRWGPLVTPDPFVRRAGMRFPPFVQMFLLALAKELSK